MNETILIVDRQIAFRQIIQHALQKMYYQTVVVDNAEQAYRYLAQNKPHLIIVDDELDDVSGGQLCRRIKNTTSTHDIPVIMHSQGLRVTNPDYVKATGADIALHRPVPIDTVINAVKTLCESPNFAQSKKSS